jgi:hypothetical protein
VSNNKIWHASLLIALLAVTAAVGHPHSRLSGATACDCQSLSQAVDARASDTASATTIDVAKTTVTRIPSRSKTSGDRITGTNGLVIPPLLWRPALERPTALIHIDRDRSEHAGRAPPTL